MITKRIFSNVQGRNKHFYIAYRIIARRPITRGLCEPTFECNEKEGEKIIVDCSKKNQKDFWLARRYRLGVQICRI